MKRALVLLTMTAVVTGCRAAPTGLGVEEVARLSQFVYPQRATDGPDLDIVVTRRGRSIHLANRTPRTYHHMQVWLNQQYVHPVEQVAIGTDNLISLRQFINRHRESFPVGSFLRPEKSFPVVLAELYDPEADVRYRLIVQPLN